MAATKIAIPWLQWYSFDDGLVHWIAIDTEVFEYGTPDQATAMYDFITSDLAAVDRSVTPWVIAYGHKVGDKWSVHIPQAEYEAHHMCHRASG
jgi:hypothetical protein